MEPKTIRSHPRRLGKREALRATFILGIRESLARADALCAAGAGEGRVAVQVHTDEEARDLREYFSAEQWYRIDVYIRPSPEPWTISIIPRSPGPMTVIVDELVDGELAPGGK